MPQVNMKHDFDPRQTITDKVGDISKIQVTYSQVLIGIYMRPTKTASGIYLSDQTIDEDKYQGKVGLVLKKGPLAFKNTDAVDFHGFEVEEGDWVVIRPSDGWAISIHGQDCRMVSDAGIRMVVDAPDAIW